MADNQQRQVSGAEEDLSPREVTGDGCFGANAASVTTRDSVFAFRDPISRRRFIKSVVTSSALITGSCFVPRALLAESSATPAAGTVARLLRLHVNGRLRPVDVMANETLAVTIRYRLGLTGTKLGCDRGECGACTVLVDNVPLNSCSVLTHCVRDRKITTVEGLVGPGGELHPVQQAMIEELAPQCGFCTPGQIMTSVALLMAQQQPTRTQVRSALAGNLCRCGAYEHYVNAVMRAARKA